MTTGIERIYGKYELEPHTCPNCGGQYSDPVEKMTDVQLASHLISDGFKDKYDTAIIISGDRDLVPAIEICRAEFKKKRIVVAFPPMRTCDDLKRVANAFIHVTETVLKKSIFPNSVIDSVGNCATCPPSWT